MNFFVGQRVRVKAITRKEARIFLGCETTITSQSEDKWFLSLIWPHGKPAWCQKIDASNCLEPIVPDGHRACDDDFKRDLDRLLERQGIAA